jgi:hypothetical protein
MVVLEEEEADGVYTTVGYIYTVCYCYYTTVLYVVQQRRDILS